MDMPTDTERREVAENLRYLADYPGAPVRYAEQFRDELSEVVLPGGFTHDYSEMFTRLADLIEPNRGSGGRTILCAHCESASWCGCEPGDEEGGCDFEPSVTEGEPPYNLYSLYEVVFRRYPRDKDAIEDDEVDELVDALLDICNAPGYERIQRPQPSCDRDALLALADDLWNMSDELPPAFRDMGVSIANRIRGALGIEP